MPATRGTRNLMKGAFFQTGMVATIIKCIDSSPPIYGDYLIINTFFYSDKKSIRIVSLILIFLHEEDDFIIRCIIDHSLL